MVGSNFKWHFFKLLNKFSSCSSSNCKNSLMARKKYLWLVDFLKSPENVVCIVIKMADAAKKLVLGPACTCVN